MSGAMLLVGPAVIPGQQADPNGHQWAHDWLNVEGGGFRCVLCLTPGYRKGDALAICPQAGGSVAGLAVGVDR
ncbi:hypothetical protein [Streptomyces coffeae]|uniref:Uncharacterized protein n=1 Tax=Streptomyces coffeae TaxID=621382 RepID=A0ABS1NLH4_9ACTN|nr:hypothetical protein [Streptomyces coffeae]MBL1100616.1 hypothetical protein [Streptomyces coffeae]